MELKSTKRDFVRVSIGPKLVEDGFIGRIVQFADGSGEVQMWDGSVGKIGPVDAYDILRGTRTTRAELIALGVPEKECDGALE